VTVAMDLLPELLEGEDPDFVNYIRALVAEPRP